MVPVAVVISARTYDGLWVHFPPLTQKAGGGGRVKSSPNNHNFPVVNRNLCAVSPPPLPRTSCTDRQLSTAPVAITDRERGQEPSTKSPETGNAVLPPLPAPNRGPPSFPRLPPVLPLCSFFSPPTLDKPPSPTPIPVHPRRTPEPRRAP